MAGRWAVRDARRAAREAQYACEDDARSAEERRKAELSLYMRIEEADISQELKDILHLIIGSV